MKRKTTYCSVLVFLLSTIALIAYTAPVNADNTGPIEPDGIAKSMDWNTKTLTVRAEDPKDNPKVFSWLMDSLSYSFPNASYSSYYKIDLLEDNDYYKNITVKYTGVSQTLKNQVKNYSENLKYCNNEKNDCNFSYTIDDMRLLDARWASYGATFSTMSDSNGWRDTLRLSRAYQDHINHRNIYVALNPYRGEGNGEAPGLFGSSDFITEVSGTAALIYNDYVYDVYDKITAKLQRVVYIPSSTEDTQEAYMAAAKKRIQQYIGATGTVSILDTSGGDYDYSDYNDVKLQYSGQYIGRDLSSYLGMNVYNNDYYSLKYRGLTQGIVIVKNDNLLSTENFNQTDVKTNVNVKVAPLASNLNLASLIVTKYSATQKSEDIERAGLQYGEAYNITTTNPFNVTIGLGHYNGASASVTIDFPIPEMLRTKDIKIFYVSDNGVLKELPVSIQGNHAITHFQGITDEKFGDYIIGTAEQVDNNPAQHDDPIIPDNPASTVVDVTEGLYAIRSFTKNNFVFDIAGGSTKNGANAQLYSSNNSAAQKFIIRKNPDNTYRIENLASEKVLDVAGGSTRNGTNVWQYSYNGTCAQKWIFLKNADNSYTIKSSCGDKVLDIAGGAIRNSGNIQIYESNGTVAQKFTLSLIQDLPGEPEISDGFYKIVASSDNTYGITVAQNSLNTGSNIQLGRSNQKESQFAIRHVKDGFYRIANINSLRVLDVAGGSGFSGANIQQYDWNGTKAQLWAFKKNSDNSYSIMSRTSLLCADMSGGYIANNVNIQLWACNNTVAQKFNLIAQ